MDDVAVSSFEALVDDVPRWIERLDRISEAALTKQVELLATNQPTDADGTGAHPPSPWPRRKKLSRASSLASKRSHRLRSEDDASLPRTPSPLPSLLRPQLPHMTHSDALRLSQRKRKTASNASGESGPRRWRTRMRLVVYYDGDAQKHLDEMVAEIVSCRNGLRRGKLIAQNELLPRRTSTSSSGSASSHENRSQLRAMLRSPRSLPPTSFNTSVEIASFDHIDKCLEKSQLACERAAHALLRDGDCSPEVHTAKKSFEEAKRLAEMELPKLKELAGKAAQQREKREKRDSHRQIPPVPAIPQQAPTPVPSPSPFAAPSTPGEPLETGELEVDDDDGDDDDDDGSELDISALQLPVPKFTSARHPSGATFTAH